MMLDILIQNESQFDHVELLPNYAKNIIVRLRQSGKTDQEIYKIWLDDYNNANISPYGAPGPDRHLGERIETELRELICGKERYTDLRKEVLEKWKTHKSAVLMSISAAIGATVGLASTVILVSVALFINVIASIGMNIWCGSAKPS